MNTIPWYRSSVFTAGLLAFLTQLATMFDGVFLAELLEGKPGALGRAAAAVLTAAVVAVRAVATAQPLTLTQGQADAANAPVQPRRQSGYAHPLMVALLLATAVIATPLLQGCESVGLQPAQSFAQRYAYALSQTSALRVAATQALQARQISTSDAEYVLKLTDESRKLLESAKLIVETGQAVKGQSQLELAITILTQLQSYLTARATP